MKQNRLKFALIAVCCLALVLVFTVDVNAQKKSRNNKSKQETSQRLNQTKLIPHKSQNINAADFNGMVTNGVYTNKALKFSFKLPDDWTFYSQGKVFLNNSLTESVAVEAEPNKEGSLDLIVTNFYVQGVVPSTILSVRRYQATFTNAFNLQSLGRQIIQSELKNKITQPRVTKQLSPTKINDTEAYYFEIASSFGGRNFLQKTFVVQRSSTEVVRLTWVFAEDDDTQVFDDTMKTFKFN